MPLPAAGPPENDQGPAPASPSEADPGAPARRPDAAPVPPSPGRRADVLLTLAIVFGFVGIIAIRPILRRLSHHPSPEQCAALLDRYGEQELRAAEPSRPPPDRHPAPPAPIERCVRERTTEEIDCAMRANNSDEIERCLP